MMRITTEEFKLLLLGTGEYNMRRCLITLILKYPEKVSANIIFDNSFSTKDLCMLVICS